MKLLSRFFFCTELLELSWDKSIILIWINTYLVLLIIILPIKNVLEKYEEYYTNDS